MRAAGLRSVDASGRVLGSRFVAGTAGVRIVVDVTHARFPVTIDPTWTSTSTPTAALTNAGGSAGDQLGASVALSSDGTTALVGASGVGGNKGAAYVFHLSGEGSWSSSWTPTATLTNAGGSASDALGQSAALSSDATTALLGASFVSSTRGAAYVFRSSFASPSLTASAPASGPAGSAVLASSISGALSGGASPTGTVTSKVLGPQSTAPSDCSAGTTVGTANVNGNSTYHPSAGFTPLQAGDYWWFVVSYTPPTVVDEGGETPIVGCLPASGSLFAIATTTVTCTVSDADDSNSPVTATFTVTVEGALARLQDLLASVGGLPSSTARSVLGVHERDQRGKPDRRAGRCS